MTFKQIQEVVFTATNEEIDNSRTLVKADYKSLKALKEDIRKAWNEIYDEKSLCSAIIFGNNGEMDPIAYHDAQGRGYTLDRYFN